MPERDWMKMVLSYDHTFTLASTGKTVYIAAAPNTAYRIIDANGRVLKDGITQSDRDEVRLGRSSGIVVVIINGKTYKVAY